jgi:hypothetical protein
VDVFHHDLKAIKTSGFGHLDFGRKAFNEVLVDDAVRSGEESKDMGDEKTLSGSQFLPMGKVMGEVDFFCCPEGRLCLFVEVPDL